MFIFRRRYAGVYHHCGNLNTANEGEFLGKKWSSIWIPVRSSIGIFLLLPRASGYSTIQVLMMWIIIQGVGLADSVWNSALDYLANGGVVIVQQGLALDTGNVIPSIANIFRSEVCLSTMQNILVKGYNQAQKNNPSSISDIPYPPNY